MHQILLSRYFREELKQRIWETGLSQEGPTESCLVTLGQCQAYGRFSINIFKSIYLLIHYCLRSGSLWNRLSNGEFSDRSLWDQHLGAGEEVRLDRGRNWTVMGSQQNFSQSHRKLELDDPGVVTPWGKRAWISYIWKADKTLGHSAVFSQGYQS